MSLEYAKQQESDNLIGQIKNCHFYNNQYCYVDSTELPVLQADNSDSYWGNENDANSSLLLASINASLGGAKINMPGAITFYPFYKSEYALPEELISENYPFATTKGMSLSGSYQFGGHRNFKDQNIFAPEDCSSSVGKATGLTTEQIKTITTSNMRENYSSYGYELVTKLKNINEHQLELIQSGDIYLYKTHTAIIATLPDNYSNITTLQFTRDIDRAEDKILGGGLYDYNLSEKIKEDINSHVYILRAESSKPLGEEMSSLDFLNKIDNAYTNLYPNGLDEDVVGDCSIFFKDLE